jgi:hypothetical protein
MRFGSDALRTPSATDELRADGSPDVAPHYKEVIAPLVQNLVNNVQIDTKAFKLLSRHTQPCLIGAISYKLAPLPTRVSATVELEDGPVSDFLQKPPHVFLNSRHERSCC